MEIWILLVFPKEYTNVTLLNPEEEVIIFIGNINHDFTIPSPVSKIILSFIGII